MEPRAMLVQWVAALAWVTGCFGQAVPFTPQPSDVTTRRPSSTATPDLRGAVALTANNCTQTITLKPPSYQVQEFRILQAPGLRCVLTFVLERERSVWQPLPDSVPTYWRNAGRRSPSTRTARALHPPPPSPTHEELTPPIAVTRRSSEASKDSFVNLSHPPKSFYRHPGEARFTPISKERKRSASFSQTSKGVPPNAVDPRFSWSRKDSGNSVGLFPVSQHYSTGYGSGYISEEHKRNFNSPQTQRNNYHSLNKQTGHKTYSIGTQSAPIKRNSIGLDSFPSSGSADNRDYIHFKRQSVKPPFSKKDIEQSAKASTPLFRLAKDYSSEGYSDYPETPSYWANDYSYEQATPKEYWWTYNTKLPTPSKASIIQNAIPVTDTNPGHVYQTLVEKWKSQSTPKYGATPVYGPWAAPAYGPSPPKGWWQPPSGAWPAAGAAGWWWWWAPSGGRGGWLPAAVPPPKSRLLLEVKDVDVTPGVFTCEYGGARVYSVSRGLPSLLLTVCGSSNSSTAVLPEDGLAIVTYASSDEVAAGTGFTISVQTIQTSPSNIASRIQVPTTSDWNRSNKRNIEDWNFQAPPSYTVSSQETPQFVKKKEQIMNADKLHNVVNIYSGSNFNNYDSNNI